MSLWQKDIQKRLCLGRAWLLVEDKAMTPAFSIIFYRTLQRRHVAFPSKIVLIFFDTHVQYSRGVIINNFTVYIHKCTPVSSYFLNGRKQAKTRLH